MAGRTNQRVMHPRYLTERRLCVPWVDPKSARVALFVSKPSRPSKPTESQRASSPVDVVRSALSTTDNSADHTHRQWLSGTWIEDAEPSGDGLQGPTFRAIVPPAASSTVRLQTRMPVVDSVSESTATWPKLPSPGGPSVAMTRRSFVGLRAFRAAMAAASRFQVAAGRQATAMFSVSSHVARVAGGSPSNSGVG